MPEEIKKQAFDVKDLVEKLKVAGLPLAEEAGHAVVKAVFEWVEESAKLSESKVDDIVIAVLPSIRSFIDSKLDGIAK